MTKLGIKIKSDEYHIKSSSPWVSVSAAVVEANFLEGGRGDDAETEDGRLGGQNFGCMKKIHFHLAFTHKM